MVIPYWKIGRRIRRDILNEKRRGYGEQIVSALQRQLTAEFGGGFTRTNLFNMILFAEVFPDPQTVHALSGQMTWTHVRQIIYLENPVRQEFYAEMCRLERWSTRMLHAKINRMLFERTALSKKPAELALQELKALREEEKLSPDLVFAIPTCSISWD